MKLTSIKAIAAKGMTLGLLAGAFVLAGPAKAEAQQVVLRVGYPHSYYYGYGHPRFVRHDTWVRAHDRHYYGYRGRW
jgi:hypothetical protein